MLAEAAQQRNIKLQVSYSQELQEDSLIYADEERCAFVLLQCLQYAVQQVSNTRLMLSFSFLRTGDEPCFGLSRSNQ